MIDEGSAPRASDSMSADDAEVVGTNGSGPSVASTPSSDSDSVTESASASPATSDSGLASDNGVTAADSNGLSSPEPGENGSSVTGITSNGKAPGTVAEVNGGVLPSENGHDAAASAEPNGAELSHEDAVNGLEPGASATPAPLSAQIEAVLFVTDGPVALKDLSKALNAQRRDVNKALTRLAGGYDGKRGLRLQRTNGHVQLVSAPETAGAVASFIGLERSTRLSKAALETLSIVAYRQPVTRPEVEELRGVDSDAVVRNLASRGLIEPIGRRDTVGLPIEYATTFLFLEYFGLSGLDDLPSVERNGLGAPPAFDA